MRSKIALIGSICAFGTIYAALYSLAHAVGLPTYIDFGETIVVTRGSGPARYDEEISGQTTDVGLYALLASLMLAWRGYHWILSGRLSGNLDREASALWKYWFLGSTAYVLISTPVWNIPIPFGVQRLLVLAIGAGVARFAYVRYGKLQVSWRSDPGAT